MISFAVFISTPFMTFPITIELYQIDVYQSFWESLYAGEMDAPAEMPIGLLVSRTAKTLGRAFDDALAAAGGSSATWLVLLAIKTNQATTQRALADQLGIRQPTLVHHLNGMEASGLVRRGPHPDDRRAQRLVLTDKGEKTFLELRDVALRFDRRLRRGIDAKELAVLRATLATLAGNAATTR
jgi:MarR family transcriptional regulator, transcriptional regulator for hemolysin